MCLFIDVPPVCSWQTALEKQLDNFGAKGNLPICSLLAFAGDQPSLHRTLSFPCSIWCAQRDQAFRAAAQAEGGGGRQGCADGALLQLVPTSLMGTPQAGKVGWHFWWAMAALSLPSMLAEVVLGTDQQKQEGSGFAEVHWERWSLHLSCLRGFISRFRAFRNCILYRNIWSGGATYVYLSPTWHLQTWTHWYRF